MVYYNEAIKNLQTIQGMPLTIQMAIDALEKQIPKKPKHIDHWTLCPTCYDKYGFSYDILVGMRGLKTGKCHCLNCGQAIDWSNEE